MPAVQRRSVERVSVDRTSSSRAVERVLPGDVTGSSGLEDALSELDVKETGARLSEEKEARRSRIVSSGPDVQRGSDVTFQSGRLGVPEGTPGTPDQRDDDIQGASTYDAKASQEHSDPHSWEERQPDRLVAAAALAANTWAINCVGKHGLKSFVTRRDGFECNVCGAAQPCGNTMYSCRICDYDVCEVCAGHAERFTRSPSFTEPHAPSTEESITRLNAKVATEISGQRTVGAAYTGPAGESPSLRSFRSGSSISVVHRTVSTQRDTIPYHEIARQHHGRLTEQNTVGFPSHRSEPEPEPEPEPELRIVQNMEEVPRTVHHRNLGLNQTLNDLASMPVEHWNIQPTVSVSEAYPPPAIATELSEKLSDDIQEQAALRQQHRAHQQHQQHQQHKRQHETSLDTPTAVTMVVELEPGSKVASDTIEINQSDTPLVLAAKFVAKHGLKERVVVPLSEKIAREQESLRGGLSTAAGARGAPAAEGTTRLTASTMVVELEPGSKVGSDTIEISPNDQPLILAAQFVAKHGLKERITVPLSAKIAREQQLLRNSLTATTEATASATPALVLSNEPYSTRRQLWSGNGRTYPYPSATVLSPQEEDLLRAGGEAMSPIKFRSRPRSGKSASPGTKASLQPRQQPEESDEVNTSKVPEVASETRVSALATDQKGQEERPGSASDVATRQEKPKQKQKATCCGSRPTAGPSRLSE